MIDAQEQSWAPRSLGVGTSKQSFAWRGSVCRFCAVCVNSETEIGFVLGGKKKKKRASLVLGVFCARSQLYLCNVFYWPGTRGLATSMGDTNP